MYEMRGEQWPSIRRSDVIRTVLTLPQDWFHESCLNLLVPPAPGELGKRRPSGEEEEDEEEAPVLIPSNTYDCLVCGDCVKSSPVLEGRIGTDGWMIIEPCDDGKTEWRVVGRQKLNAAESLKRPAEDRDSVIDGTTKKAKLEDGRKKAPEAAAETEVVLETEGIKESPAIADKQNEHSHTGLWKGKRDVFLAYGVRDHLKTVLNVSHRFHPLARNLIDVFAETHNRKSFLPLGRRRHL